MTEDARGPAPMCYLHPDRTALLRCSRCERPICGDDAIEAPVGYQCTSCAEGGVAVRRLTDLVVAPRLTQVLLGIIVVVFVVTNVDRSAVLSTLGLVPVAVGTGAWWQLVTSAFVHANLMHIAFNGILLWRLGELLEPRLGHARFGALYSAGLAGGSLGVMLLAWATVATPLARIPLLGFALATHPVGVTVGASGAVFGLMGAAVVAMRDRGASPWRTDIGALVLLNLVITFIVPGISVGGHVGGLVAGMAAGTAIARLRNRSTAMIALGAAGALAIAVVLGRMTLAGLTGA